MTDTVDRSPQNEGYRGIYSDEAIRKVELEQRMGGHGVKLMPCKPFLKAKKSKRVRQNTWVRI